MSLIDSSNVSMPTEQEPVSTIPGSLPNIRWWRLWYFLFNAVRQLADEVLTIFGGQTIQGGFTIDEFDLGTPINGSTITPNPSTCLKQKVTNNVAGFTIAATAETGDLELRVVNGASAGTISFSGFDIQWTGDALTTVNGSQFVIFIYGFPSKRAYIIKALQ